MSERDYSTKKYVSNRELLLKASSEDLKYLDYKEKESLYLYRHLVGKIEGEREEIQWLTEQKGMEASIKECENNIVKYNIQLSKMESEYPLRRLIQQLRDNEESRQIEASRVKQVSQEEAKQAPQEVQQKKSDKPKKLFDIKMKHLNKRTIIIASCVILCIAVIALTVALINGESEYTITFYNNKGIYFYDSRQYGEQMVIKYQDSTIYKVEKFSGEYPSEPTPPANGDYVFLGWYQNPECTDKFLFGHDEISSDINLYAKWGRKSVGYN